MPLTLADLTARNRAWTLDAFVDEVNRLLPMVLPVAAPSRAKAEVNARLVRHYTTEGVLPKPLKEGGEARYTDDHLVRALALRRLLADGYPSSVAGTVLGRHDTEALARLLVGELRVGVDLEPDVVAVQAVDPVAHQPADVRAHLADLRRRAGLPPLVALPLPERPSAPPAPARVDANRFASAAAPRADPAASGDVDRASAPAPLLRHRSLEGEAWQRRRTPTAPEPPAVAPTARVGEEGGVGWTRYPLLEGLELHVRADFSDPPTPAARERLRDVLLARLEAIALEREGRRR